VTIDTGDPKLLHPPNKKPVGERLALLALARTYKLPVHDSGPTYVSSKVQGGKIRVVLANADGLHSPNTPLEEFAVAGADKKFHPAVALIEGTSLVVSSPDVAHPVAVRYACSDGPEKADIYNADGLPLAPFRTDDWQFPSK
jgi:sialate O-acetylesterase